MLGLRFGDGVVERRGDEQEHCAQPEAQAADESPRIAVRGGNNDQLRNDGYTGCNPGTVRKRVSKHLAPGVAVGGPPRVHRGSRGRFACVPAGYV